MTELTAGRELDARVARDVMGHALYQVSAGKTTATLGILLPEKPGSSFLANTAKLPEYSTSIADAWLVVERLISLGFHPNLRFDPMGAGTGWECVLLHPRTVADADTAPLAICKAALAALDSGVKG